MLLSNSDEISPHLSKSADLCQGTHKYDSPSALSTTQNSSIYSSIRRMSIVSAIYLLNGLSLTASSLNLALFWSLVVDLEEATLHAHSLVRDLMSSFLNPHTSRGMIQSSLCYVAYITQVSYWRKHVTIFDSLSSLHRLRGEDRPTWVYIQSEPSVNVIFIIDMLWSARCSGQVLAV